MIHLVSHKVVVNDNQSKLDAQRQANNHLLHEQNDQWVAKARRERDEECANHGIWFQGGRS